MPFKDKEVDRKWWAAKRKTEKNKTYQKFYSIKRKYGITKDDYDLILRTQGGRCALCSNDKNLAVDHCHKTNRVRAILCLKCNTAIGHMERRPQLQLDLVRYIHGHKQFINKPYQEGA